MKLSSLVIVGAVCVVACSGSIATIPDAGGGGDGSSGDDSGAKGDSGKSDGGGGGDSGGPSCDQRRQTIDGLRPAAAKCCPSCNHAPCQFVVQDLCCPLTVDAQTSSDVQAFEQAVSAYNSAGCQTPCPAIPCPPAPSKQCDFNTSECVQ